MSDESVVNDILAHHGVKGMHWGVHRDRTPVYVTVHHKPGKKIKAKGGTNQNAHPDAVQAAIGKRIAKKSTTDALSDRELQSLVNRMNLEQQYSRLSSGTKGEGRKFAEQQLRQHGQQSITKAIAKRAAKTAAVAAAL